MAGPPGFRVQLFYSYGGRGFSETFWSNTLVTSPQGIDQYIQDVYAPQRMAIADDDLSLDYVRWSQYPATRVATIRDYTASGIVGKLSGNGSAPDDVVLCKLSNPSSLLATAYAFLHLHAFPASIVKQNFLVPGSWGTKLQAFLAYLSTQSVFVLKTKTVSNLTTKYNIVSVSPGLNRGFTVVPVGGLPAGLVAGNKVRISGFPSSTVGYTGTKVVTGVFPAGIAPYFEVGGAIPAGTPPTGVGSFYVLSEGSATIGYAQALRLSERKTGRPFELPVGRKRNTLPLRR